MKCRPYARARVPPSRLPARHPPRCGDAVIPPRHDVEERRNPPAAPTTGRRAASTGRARSAEGVLGRPGPDRVPARPDTENPAPRAVADHHPGTILRWRRDILRRRWAARSKPKCRPATRRSIKALVLGITVAPSTVWAILKKAGIDPAPRRRGPTWAQFLRSQAQAVLATDFFTVDLLDGTPAYVLTMIEHAARQIRILGATAHPTAAWTVQIARNALMDLEDHADGFKFPIRDRGLQFTTASGTDRSESNSWTAPSSGTSPTFARSWPSMSPSTTNTGPTGLSARPRHCAHSRTAWSTSTTSTSPAATGSAASSTNTV
jgi:hypothetical protein